MYAVRIYLNSLQILIDIFLASSPILITEVGGRNFPAYGQPQAIILGTASTHPRGYYVQIRSCAKDVQEMKQRRMVKTTRCNK